MRAVQISHVWLWKTGPSSLPNVTPGTPHKEVNVGSERIKQHRWDVEIWKNSSAECGKIQGKDNN